MTGGFANRGDKMSETVSGIFGICTSIYLVIYGFFGTIVKSVGILQDDCVEIILKNKECRIEYAQIKEIREKTFLFSLLKAYECWCVKIHNEPTVRRFKALGFGSKTSCLLENFMMALQGKLNQK